MEILQNIYDRLNLPGIEKKEPTGYKLIFDPEVEGLARVEADGSLTLSARAIQGGLAEYVSFGFSLVHIIPGRVWLGHLSGMQDFVIIGKRQIE